MSSRLIPSAVELLDQLQSEGVSLATDGAQLRVWPRTSLSWTDRAAIRRRKSELLALLSARDSASPSAQPNTEPIPDLIRRNEGPQSNSQIETGAVPVSYGNGHSRLTGPHIAISITTAIAVGHEIPPITLIVASDGQQHVIFNPDDLGAFLLAHRDVEFVCFDVGRVFWAVHNHLILHADTEALGVWLRVVHDHRLHDVRLLDILLRLAGGEAEGDDDDEKRLEPRGLHEIAATCRILTPSAIINPTPSGRPVGVNSSGVNSAEHHRLTTETVSILSTYRDMHDRAVKIMTRNGYSPNATGCFLIAPDATRRFGVLTEAIQVEAAIALAQIQRNGLRTSMERLRDAIGANHRELNTIIVRLRADYHRVLKFDAAGNLERTPTGLPSYSSTELDHHLVRTIEEIGRRTGTVIEIPRGKNGGISHSQEAWEPFAELHPFPRLWFAFEKAAKQSQFLAVLNQPVIHPEYRVIVRTGRTSCRSPNIQQIPRGDTFREIIIPSPGHLLLPLDYAFVELVTLAVICKTRFGFSRLCDVICAGIDPHCFTAAAILKLPLTEFMALKNSDDARFKQCRRYAKPINFGIPVGFGPEALVKYALKTYGVVMTLEQAVDLRRRLIEEVYPELELYLSERGSAWFDSPENRSTRIHSQLRGAAAVTPTGRVRGSVGYTQQRNSPFQGLAADGAKRALFRLVLAGFRVVGFVHDEILVELPDQGGYVDRAIVESVVQIMRESMEEMTYGIPVTCEYALCDRWSKNAELIVDGDKVRPWRPAE